VRSERSAHHVIVPIAPSSSGVSGFPSNHPTVVMATGIANEAQVAKSDVGRFLRLRTSRTTLDGVDRPVNKSRVRVDRRA